MGITKLFRRGTETVEPEPEAAPVATGPDDEFRLGDLASINAADYKVLVIDDNEDIRDLMVLTLQRAGFNVVGSTDDPEAALAINLRERPQLILLDLHMPEVNGVEMLPFLKQDTPGVRVVVVSAISASYMTEAAMKAGANAFIVKGVSPRSIVAHLHKVARKGSVNVVLPFPLVGDYPEF
jgi:DNA-binding NarL/FixJ family response regulator